MVRAKSAILSEVVIRDDVRVCCQTRLYTSELLLQTTTRVLSWNEYNPLGCVFDKVVARSQI